jgi:hypothetical protein
MIDVAVGQQEPLKPPESGAAPEQLPLGPLSAIDEHALAANHDEQARMIELRQWNAGRRAEEHLFWVSVVSAVVLVFDSLFRRLKRTVYHHRPIHGRRWLRDR